MVIVIEKGKILVILWSLLSHVCSYFTQSTLIKVKVTLVTLIYGINDSGFWTLYLRDLKCVAHVISLFLWFHGL